jgi:tetratricopeptide (TPR) repeat protein
MAGVKPDQVEQAISRLVDEAHLAARTWSSPQMDNAPEPMQRLVAVGRLLYQSGRRDLALELYSRGADLPTSEALAELPIARAYILQSILRINRPDWLMKVLNQGPESAITGAGRNYLAHVFEVETETVDSLAMGLGFILKSSDKPLAEAVFDFLSGEVPERFDPKTDYQRLFDTLSGQRVVQRLSALDQRFRNRMPRRITLDFVKLFESHGQFDLAVRAMLENISVGDNDALLTYAENELKAGRTASAREIFRSVWQRLEEARQSPSRLNRAEEDVTLAMRAILGEAVSAGRMGDGEEAESLWRLIELMNCSPSAKMRDAFGETLMDQGFDERAEAIYRTLMPWVAFGSDEGVQFQAVARNFSRALGDRHEKLASEVFDLAIAGTIESTFFYPAGYVLFPTLVHRMKVNAAISEGDEAEISRQVEALLRLSPMDIDFGENAIKKMRAAGMDDLAKQTIARVYDAGSKYMQQFPLDIVTGNNLAWVMALSDYRLEDALALSKQTVYFAPDSTVYRDTLAEVLFRLARVDEAIAIEQACLLDEPGEWHVHEQLQRFRAEQQK